MPATFKANTEELGDGISAIVLSGELDQATLPELERELEAVIANGSGGLLVDLSDCAFIDSSGLAALVGARERLVSGGDRGFGICCPDSQVLRLLELTGLDRAMGVAASRDEALEALRP